MSDVDGPLREELLALVVAQGRMVGQLGAENARLVHAAVATFALQEIRGSAFGLLAPVQAIGNVAASAIAGLLYTVTSTMVALAYLVVWMLIALVILAWAARSSSGASAGA